MFENKVSHQQMIFFNMNLLVTNLASLSFLKGRPKMTLQYLKGEIMG